VEVGSGCERNLEKTLHFPQQSPWLDGEGVGVLALLELTLGEPETLVRMCEHVLVDVRQKDHLTVGGHGLIVMPTSLIEATAGFDALPRIAELGLRVLVGMARPTGVERDLREVAEVAEQLFDFLHVQLR